MNQQVKPQARHTKAHGNWQKALMSLFHTESPGVKEIQVQAGQDWNPDVESAGMETNSNIFILYCIISRGVSLRLLTDCK